MISGILGFLLILVAIICFLRRRKRANRNGVDMPYSPIDRAAYPQELEGQLETHQLPPIRTTTPLTWPVHPSPPSEPPNTSANNDVGDAKPMQGAEPTSNPFEDVHTTSTIKLVDVASVKSSTSLQSDGGNPFEDNANQYWSRDSGGSCFDAAYPESEMLHMDDNPDRASSTTVTEQGARTNHLKSLSMTSDCPYPVLEPDTQQPFRNMSMKSGLSYATLDPERVKQLQDQLSRASSTSSFSGVVHVSIFLSLY